MDILATVKTRLTALGYTVTASDLDTLNYYIKKAETALRVKTNRTEVPTALLYVWVDMAAGMFLQDKKTAGGLADIYDFSAPAKSVSEGDTSVTFAIADTASFEEQFDAMLDKMVKPDDDYILAFRRLTW